MVDRDSHPFVLYLLTCNCDSSDDLKAAGVDEVVIYCVNDPAVMQAWSEDQGVKGIVTMMGDPAAEFTKAIDLEMVSQAGVLHVSTFCSLL